MKAFILAMCVLGSTVGTSFSVRADDDRRDHDWNDEYWHDHDSGYWHGHQGHWAYHHHKHKFIQVGPVTIEKH